MTGVLAALGFVLLATQAQQPQVVQYQGTLPCADCTGIQTVLVLNPAGPSSPEEGTFTLRETYQRGASPDENRTFVTEGRWKTIHRTDIGGAMTICQLTPEPQGRARYFQQENDTTLKLLDNEQRPIESALDYTLRRTDAAAVAGAYAPVATDVEEVRAAAEF